ncbi:MAG: sulfite exporter TauE/SafE family protein [Burkholderiales bacterium]|nr:sulfite exporter TauE/SafE family protein [Burkholderiales bacterium]
MFSLPVAAALAASVIATSFISGIFGMAGGMILMGILLLFVPVAQAMMLHGAAQLASNGSRAWLWRAHIRWRSVGYYLAGSALPVAAFVLVGFAASKPVVLLSLGLMPLAVMALPADIKPDAERAGAGIACGVVCSTLQLLTGVSGPVLDSFFTGSPMDRKSLVATKGAIQTFGHLLKIAYFGQFVTLGGDGVPPLALGAAVLLAVFGTNLSKKLLERMSDVQFRAWTQRLILGISLVYVAQGLWLLWRG